MMAPMNADNKPEWAEARALYGQGKSARQIAHGLALPIAKINQRAMSEHWPAPPPPDWRVIRSAWESGQTDRALAQRYGVSASGLQKRRRREGWSRHHERGIDALRRAVRTLEAALDNADLADTVLTTRLATALSMAAGRLRDAEKQLYGHGQNEAGNELAQNLEGENEALREQMTTMLMRLAGEEEPEDEGAGKENPA